ncbi:cell surface protein [Salinisphaera sp. Q1T1-3]|uniref:cell surface protein n=1 Tax=Salinisphaera sp. Q1T1-3 TaxID=2321229 RepID=UPI000E72E0A1|nr:cell surface protein [Salinisphaera sp. Q1T1-3]RJS94150.1 cell surface protein [Salinisphaera sp. Q1T1-3]
MTSVMHFLESATAKLAAVGVPTPSQEPAPVLGLLERLEPIDPDRVLVIARTLQQAGHFNEVVRTHIRGHDLADRYNQIAEDFTSIREDVRTLVNQRQNGRLSLSQRLQQRWMKLRRGSIEARFQDIARTYRDVIGDSRAAIEREQAILAAYADFRGALKQSEVEAHALHEQTETQLAGARETLETRERALSEAEGDRQRAEAELARDQAMAGFEQARKNEQIAKDLAENLQISYATGETVMGRLSQSSDVKERVYEQSVAFFSTNESVFTALAATFVSLGGLHESTQTLERMKQGMNESIETLADVGDDVLTEGTRAGYGPGLRAESVAKLVDAIGDYQQRTFETTREMRQLATENANEVANLVEAGKARYSRLLHEEPAADPA